MTRCVLGIDPGLGGAAALWCSDERRLSVFDMPVLELRKGNGKPTRSVDAVALADWLRQHQHLKISMAYVERVHAMPGQGVTSMFTFGAAYGVVLGVLAVLKVPHALVEPALWMKLMKVGKGVDASRMRAIQLFPEHGELFRLKKSHGRADAAMLAYLCDGIG